MVTINATREAWVNKARDVRIEEVVERHGMKLRGSVDRCGPCPVCGEGKDRFSVNTRKQVFNCRKCEAKGDVINLVQYLDHVDFLTACEVLTGEPRPRPKRREKPPPADAWKRVWHDSVDPRGTLVEHYLRSRHLTLPDEVAGRTIRFHAALWRDGSSHPGMVALIRDIHSNEPCGIHRTFLDSDGKKLDRRMLGRAGNAAIKLSANEDVEQGLHIGEGVETCLAAMLAGYRPTWAVGSAGGIAKFPLLAGIDAINILSERNDGGANQQAVEQLRETWTEREVLLVEPLLGDDINDAWRADHAR